MGAGRFVLAFCLPFVVFSHNHGGYINDHPQTGGKPESLVVPELQIPAYPFDGKRCISFARKTKIIDIPLPYLCIPGKPGGIPLPQRNDRETQATLIAMYWSGWRVCQQEFKMPMNDYIKVQTCCPGWESGPMGDCTVPKKGVHGPCQNGGFLSPDSRSPRCICPPGFKGTLCQMPCPMALRRMKPFVDRIPNTMKQILPQMQNLMETQRRNMMNTLGPRNVQLRNMLIPTTIVKKINPFSVPGVMRFSKPNPMTMFRIMAMKKIMDQRKNPLPRVNILPVLQNQANSQQPRNNPPMQILNPTYTINDKGDSVAPNQQQNPQQLPQPLTPVGQILPQKSPVEQPQQHQQQQQQAASQPQQFYQPNNGIPQRAQIPQIPQSAPYFIDKMVTNEESCKEILKIGITRCVQEAGVNAMPEAIFESANPNNAQVIQQLCRLPANQLSTCVLAGQNACGNGIQIGITRRMLLEFLSNLGQKCIPQANPVPSMYNAGIAPVIQPYNAVRMPPFMHHVTPHASMVPLPPTNLRTGRKPFLPLPENRIMAIPPLGQDLKRLDCLNGGYVVLEHGKSVCQCPEGFIGETCETAICSPECLNGGNCETVDGMALCICTEGFTGLQCKEAISETEADITAIIDDTSLTHDTAVATDADQTSQVIDRYPIPHIPNASPEGYITTENPAIEKTSYIPPSPQFTQTVENQKLGQVENVDPVKDEIKEYDVNMDDYPLWMILSVSFGALLLVLLLTTCVCMCVKRRTRRVVTVTSQAAALPEKSPMKDNIYVVGIPPPVYEVKGIPPLSYEEAKGEVISGDTDKDIETAQAAETVKKDDEDKKEIEVTRI